MPEQDRLTTMQTLWILFFYGSGWVLDWGYFIALGREEGTLATIAGVVLGWIPALIWPIHAAVEFWSWVLGGT